MEKPKEVRNLCPESQNIGRIRYITTSDSRLEDLPHESDDEVQSLNRTSE